MARRDIKPKFSYAGSRTGSDHESATTGIHGVGTDYVAKVANSDQVVRFTDLTGTATAAQVPDLPASKITSGALAVARYLSALLLDGSRAMTSALNMGSHLINNVTNPVSAQDAATKNFVETKGYGIINASEAYTGANCTGSDADASGRTLTISNTSTTASCILLAIVEGLIMNSSQHSVEHNAASSIITFQVKIFDSDNIQIVYLTLT